MKYCYTFLIFLALLIIFGDAIRLLKNSTLELERTIRRPCTCRTSSGRCMSIGARQCWFNGRNNASIVECNNEGEWKMTTQCIHMCQTLQDDRPHCLVPED